jgi:hypothetical protein
MTDREIIKFWKDICLAIVSNYSESDNWKPWLAKSFVDGTLMNSSNPIYDLINDDRKRAVRIIQADAQIPSEHTHTVWLNKFGEGVSEPSEIIDELVFTYRSYQDSFQLFRDWCQGSNTSSQNSADMPKTFTG